MASLSCLGWVAQMFLQLCEVLVGHIGFQFGSHELHALLSFVTAPIPEPVLNNGCHGVGSQIEHLILCWRFLTIHVIFNPKEPLSRFLAMKMAVLHELVVGVVPEMFLLDQIID